MKLISFLYCLLIFLEFIFLDNLCQALRERALGLNIAEISLLSLLLISIVVEPLIIKGEKKKEPTAAREWLVIVPVIASIVMVAIQIR
jgi:hypothetical protein